ncbi:MAG: cation:proton antiporter subunit C [Candidatus Margulisbacteria bacterium]|nr:cation:proton antiporter subunit C [Candidatus Margulisiibacteriota bacterium]
MTLEFIIAKYNYVVYVILMMIGLWAMISKNNLIKKVMGMAIFQTSIILFYISVGTKRYASIPILDHHAGLEHAIHVEAYVNPLPHVLMLTAIVVGVGTLGVALAVIQKIYREYGTIEEDDILERLE